jgi:hypothetical protein
MPDIPDIPDIPDMLDMLDMLGMPSMPSMPPITGPSYYTPTIQPYLEGSFPWSVTDPSAMACHSINQTEPEIFFLAPWHVAQAQRRLVGQL